MLLNLFTDTQGEYPKYFEIDWNQFNLINLFLTKRHPTREQTKQGDVKREVNERKQFT